MYRAHPPDRRPEPKSRRLWQHTSRTRRQVPRLDSVLLRRRRFKGRWLSNNYNGPWVRHHLSGLDLNRRFRGSPFSRRSSNRWPSPLPGRSWTPIPSGTASNCRPL